jgi:hypothetical protein
VQDTAFSGHLPLSLSLYIYSHSFALLSPLLWSLGPLQSLILHSSSSADSLRPVVQSCPDHRLISLSSCPELCCQPAAAALRTVQSPPLMSTVSHSVLPIPVRLSAL